MRKTLRGSKIQRVRIFLFFRSASFGRCDRITNNESLGRHKHIQKFPNVFAIIEFAARMKTKQRLFSPEMISAATAEKKAKMVLSSEKLPHFEEKQSPAFSKRLQALR